MKENSSTDLKLLRRLEKRFIISEEDMMLMSRKGTLMERLRCIYCRKEPTEKDKNIRIEGMIYCKSCLGKMIL